MKSLVQKGLINLNCHIFGLMMTMITWMSLTSPERVNDPYLGVSEKSGKGYQ